MGSSFFEWLESSRLGTLIAEDPWLFPAIESVHVIALSLVVGSILMVDLRLLSVALRQRDVVELSNDVLPWTWMAFALALISGSALFVSSATSYAQNPAMQLKFVLLALAGINMVIFNLVTRRSIESWRSAPKPPRAAVAAGALSLTFWIGVIFAGRWVGFV